MPSLNTLLIQLWQNQHSTSNWYLFIACASEVLLFSCEFVHFVGLFGLTENAGVENAAPSKLQGWKTREWKTSHQVQGRIQDFKLGGCEAKESGGRKSQSPVGPRSKTPVGSPGTAPSRSSSSVNFYQHGSIASHACAGIAIAEMSVSLSVCLSIRLSVTLWYCIKTNKASVIRGFFTDAWWRARRLVFANILAGSSWNSKGVTLSEGDLWHWCGYELVRHLMGWRVLAFRQNCSEVCRAKHILLAAKLLRGLYFLTIQVLWGYSVGFPEKRKRQSGQVFSLLSHVLFGVHWCIEFISNIQEYLCRKSPSKIWRTWIQNGFQLNA